MAYAKGMKVCLYDPENGTTTGQFIEQFEKEAKENQNLVFEKVKIEDIISTVPVVTIVRSITERVEDDLDAALAKIQYKDVPIIIIYIHMKSCSSISQTKTSLIDQGKYKHVLEIIDMTFSAYQLTEGSFVNYINYGKKQLKQVNKEALSRLYKVVCECSKVKACLYDPKNGTTTEQFLAQFEKEVKRNYCIVFEKFNNKDMTSTVPVVIVVNSTHEGVEKDLDTALATIRGKDIRIIIIYIHMESFSSISPTMTSLKDQWMYKHVLEIIHMDFTESQLREGSLANYINYGKKKLKQVNREALSRLYKVLCDCTTAVKAASSLYVYDKSETIISKRVTNEVKCLLEENVEIKIAYNPSDGEPLLVVFCAKNEPSDGHVSWKEFDGSDPSNKLMICLYENEDGDISELERAPVAEWIPVKVSSDRSCMLTFNICNNILNFVSGCHWRQRLKASEQSEK